MSTQIEKTYWRSPDEQRGERGDDGPLAAVTEFGVLPQADELKPGRRGFLKATGFAFGAALSGCQPTPEHKAIPYLIQPEGLTPGRAYNYASTCGACPSGCGILATVRDGRPIKLEGNPEHPLSKGGLCAVGQASILGLYDQHRLRQPLRDGKPITWPEADKEIQKHLDKIRQEGGAVRFLSGTVVSPTLRGAIDRFLSSFKDGRHVTYDAISCSAILDAHAATHGLRVLPRYLFDRAEVLVSLDADFLGTWISPAEFAVAYNQARRIDEKKPRQSYHVQFESRLSLTGGKADRRVAVAPGEMGLLATHLVARLAEKAGEAFETIGIGGAPVSAEMLDGLADRLWQARGRSLIVCGSQDVRVQTLCNFANQLLGNYGATLDVEQPAHHRQGDDHSLRTLLGELRAGRVAALFIHQCNPVYELPGGEELLQNLAHVPLVVSCAQRVDETASRAHFICPDHHYLESWSDAEVVSGVVSLSQPALRPLGDTRPLLESLAAWTKSPKSSYEQLRERWQAEVFSRQDAADDFQKFWDRAVHDGYVRVDAKKLPRPTVVGSSVRPLLTADNPPDDALALVLYPKIGLTDGSHAYNPWLQELPDPVSKVTWDNYACLSPATAARLNLNDGDVVRIEVGGEKQTIELPVFRQPGQHDQVVAVALGYGSSASERFAKIGPQWLEVRETVGENGLVGVNAAPLLTWKGNNLRYAGEFVRLTPTGGKHALACTQTYHRLTMPERLAPADAPPRPIIQETTLQRLLTEQTQHDTSVGRAAGPSRAPDGSASRPTEKTDDPAGRRTETREDLWPDDHPTPGARWGMAIDLNSCTGCSACVVACQVENNVPVVGKDEVLREREMYWLRIDRYYSGDDADVSVAYQPMLCQHCGNAPCEAVCPVLATVHSDEGLNQQVYNRCVGTRYCANNCPYKVRRFNWFNYAHDDLLENLVLNPDVTVRSRGVMEKCSFCVQRIQDAKIAAGGRGALPADGVIQTACQQSCPTRAIAFGDLNDPASQVSQLSRDRRGYQVLEELNVRPSITYLSLVRNVPDGTEEKQRG